MSQYENVGEHQPYMMSPDMPPGLYDGTSSESSASSPMNCNAGFDNMYGGNNAYLPYPTFPMQYPTHSEGMAPLGLIPVELDIEGLYEDHDRRRKKNGSEKAVASHVHSRRRAQNRASQRAFRDRKEKHMRELEQRLSELEGRHSDLSRSYDSLQVEYSSVKQELERLRQENTKLDSGASSQSNTSSPSSSTRSYSQSKDWEESRREILDPLLFDVSAFCFDQDDGDERKD